MKAATSSRPCIESAASCRAAIHPSVRASSTSTSAGVIVRPISSLRYAAASSAVKRRSAARILEQLAARPQARQRQRRVGATRDHEVDLRRQVLDQERHRLVDLRRFDDVVVVEHQHQVVVDDVQVVEQGRDDGLHLRLATPAGAPARRRPPRARPSGAPPRRRSRTAQARCRAGRARATRSRGRRRTSSATRVVLPNPAGADTSVSAGWSCRSRRSRSRGRVTIAPRRRGACSLVSRRAMPRANHAFSAPRRSRRGVEPSPDLLAGGSSALRLAHCPPF